MKKIKEKNRGITLISLIITIVVLIIIAGIAINLTLGKNGIFNKAKEAKRMQLEAEYKEKIGTELLAAQVDAIARNEELEDEQVKDIISNYGELQDDGDTIKIKDSDIELSLSDIYTGTTTTSGSYTENKAKIDLLESQIKRLQEQLDNASLSGDEKDKKIAELNEKITELEKEISNGKATIADAITKNGVPTASDASFEDLATNIGKISSSFGQYLIGMEWEYQYTGGVKTYTVPVSGYYRLTAKGSSGSSYGAAGSTIYGDIYLKQGDVLNIYCGGTNGYNGGASGMSVTGPVQTGDNGTARSSCYSYNGGGASDFRLNGTALSDRILVAGGGGGGGSTNWVSVGSGTDANKTNYNNGVASPYSCGTLGSGQMGQSTKGTMGGGSTGSSVSTCGAGGGGGGGYYGGVGGCRINAQYGGYSGTSYLNPSKFVNYSNGTTQPITYTGTPGGNDFSCGNYSIGSNGGNGVCIIKFMGE